MLTATAAQGGSQSAPPLHRSTPPSTATDTPSPIYLSPHKHRKCRLFGHIGTPSNNHTRIEAVGLRNVRVAGNNTVGALVGESEKPVTASWTTGAVWGGTQVGGLIGLSESDVTASYSLASVNATNKGGGLIGEQDGSASTGIVRRRGSDRHRSGQRRTRRHRDQTPPPTRTTTTTAPPPR